MHLVPDSGGSESLLHSLRAALLWQSASGLAGMLVAFLRFDVQVALAIGFGVVMVMMSTVLLSRRISGAANLDPDGGSRLLYAGAVVRFMFVMSSLVLAYGLGLHLLGVAIGMMLAQTAMFVFAIVRVKAQIGKQVV